MHKRLRALFNTTEGLLLSVTVWEAVLVALLGTLSATGPLAGLDIPARLGIALDESGKAGRLIMLYHSLAVPFVAALVYFILDLLDFDGRTRHTVQTTVTVGYVLTSSGGLGFAYLGWGWTAHGLFLVGLSLVFYAGAVLWVGLWPWRAEGFSLERFAFWVMALCTLISAIIGGVTASFFGHGFEAFLAEDVTRVAEHTLGQRAVIAHLHIMLTLVDVALLLIAAHRFDLRGPAQRWTLWLTAVGTIITSLATWGVMVIEEYAHKLINIGILLLIPAGFIVAIYGFRQLVREGGGRWRALFADPVRFGVLFELIFVNVVVTAPGIYLAAHLSTYRSPAYRAVERTLAVGHWHVLATVSAVIAALLVADRLNLRGWWRQAVGWGLVGGSSLAFVCVQCYMFRLPGQDTTWTVPWLDLGIGATLLTLAAFLLRRVLVPPEQH